MACISPGPVNPGPRNPGPVKPGPMNTGLVNPGPGVTGVLAEGGITQHLQLHIPHAVTTTPAPACTESSDHNTRTCMYYMYCFQAAARRCCLTLPDQGDILAEAGPGGPAVLAQGGGQVARTRRHPQLLVGGGARGAAGHVGGLGRVWGW